METQISTSGSQYAATINSETINLNIVSYNMHGYNQGCHAARDLMCDRSVDIFMFEEHWLTPANLCKFDENFPSYMCFGSSAMNHCVETGILRGRPYGGVMTLVSRKLERATEVICASERCIIVIVGNLLLINVYLPCAGAVDRHLICEEVLNNIQIWKDKYPDNICIIGGDFNTDLDVAGSVADLINRFIGNNNLSRCDALTSNACKRATYCNEALNCQSTIDYFLTTNTDVVSSFDVIDCNINFSDHLPIMISCACKIVNSDDNNNDNNLRDKQRNYVNEMEISHLRWDHANLELYNDTTGLYLQSVYNDLSNIECCAKTEPAAIDEIYSRIVDILHYSASVAVPACKKNFFKFWWDQELDELKERSIASCQLWKAAGKPRSGPIFNKYRKEKSAYRSGIRSRQREETSMYTNDLHEALLTKQGSTFWKCWKSKFEPKKSSFSHVDGTTDANTIAEHFAQHFAKACTNLTDAGAERLKSQYEELRPQYNGMPDGDDNKFDAELLENIIVKMKRGKAAGLDGLTAEHLQFCHPILPCVLAKLFNIMMHYGHVPDSFGLSYTVPIHKGNCNIHSKTATVDDFRGISISPVFLKF